MLRIRNEQWTELSSATQRSFEQRMVVHLRKFFPQQCEALGATDLQDTIAHGIERAKTYDIVTERDVCLYIDLMMVFGRDFDTNPNLSWASYLLQDPHVNYPAHKIDQLYDTALRELKTQAAWEQNGG